MESIIVGLIGCGPRGNTHANATPLSGALKLKYACDLKDDRAKETASRLGCEATADYKKILADPAVEAVVIATDVANHLNIAGDALDAGKHMILEKPLGDDISSARKFVEKAEKSGLTIYMSLQLHFDSQLATIKKHIPEIDPVQIFFGRQRTMLKPQFLNPSPFCGILDVCAHDFDLVNWYMGKRPVAVSSVVRRNSFTKDSGAVDTISAIVDYGDGRSATIISSFGADEIGQKCDITGACGNITMDKTGNTVGVTFNRYESDGEKKEIVFDFPKGLEMDQEQQKAFQKEIRTGEKSDAARPANALDALLLTMASVKSSEEGCRVELDEV